MCYLSGKRGQGVAKYHYIDNMYLLIMISNHNLPAVTQKTITRKTSFEFIALTCVFAELGDFGFEQSRSKRLQ